MLTNRIISGPLVLCWICARILCKNNSIQIVFRLTSRRLLEPECARVNLRCIWLSLTLRLRGYCYVATATWLLLHGYCYVATASHLSCILVSRGTILHSEISKSSLITNCVGKFLVPNCREVALTRVSCLFPVVQCSLLLP